ncbi:hypothetical protein [Piscinibacter sp. XHJ-5]|uniref:hypothetical protein n=1 Tax=Piscinibacter sp. XHJ-5 TaxID=3037797 RepID=UPI002452C201|nr:hypothetical protein [Piscinibacter sp. XHJ-5]
MKALKTLLLAKGIAAAVVAGAGIAAPAISHASPDDGMICRSGYTAQFAAGKMKCTKATVRRVALECSNPLFPIKRVRVPGIPGDATNGRDVCLRNNGIALSSNDPLTGLINGQDFVFVAVNNTKAVLAREAAERQEETFLGLGTDGVDSSSVSTLVVNGGIGAEDTVKVDITLFTFPIAAPSFTLQPLELDRPVLDLPLLSRTLP